MALSEPRISIRILVEGAGEFQGELIRIHAPLTVQEFSRRLPIEGFAARWDYAIYIQTEVRRGAEKTVKSIRRGDILYWPMGGYLALAFRDYEPPAQMVKIGEFRGEYERLEKVRPGSRVRLERV